MGVRCPQTQRGGGEGGGQGRLLFFFFSFLCAPPEAGTALEGACCPPCPSSPDLTIPSSSPIVMGRLARRVERFEGSREDGTPRRWPGHQKGPPFGLLTSTPKRAPKCPLGRQGPESQMRRGGVTLPKPCCPTLKATVDCWQGAAVPRGGLGGLTSAGIFGTMVLVRIKTFKNNETRV